MEIYFLSLGILLLGALLSIVVKEHGKFKLCSFFSFLSMIGMSYSALKVFISGAPLVKTVYMSPIIGNVNFVIDTLSAFFILVIAIMSFLGILYANGYMKNYLGKGMNTSSHCFFLMTLVASMLAVVTAQNALFFLIVWEVMSLSSFFLVIFEGEKKEVRAAGIKYLVYMHLSVLFIISAFVIAVVASNSLNFADFASVLRGNEHLANIVFMLAFAGFGIKAGFVPFHNWLPDAHPAAPSHVSGIMSGVMIKTGIYGILRMLVLVGIPSKMAAYTFLVIAAVSALYGVLYAIAQHDIKRLLAYHSIENIGIIGLGIAIGMLGLAYSNPLVAALGFTGGILHVLNHSIFKELLFFAAGSVYVKTHTRNIEALGGLMKSMPYTGLMFIIGSVAICGLPPFNGFISEFLIYVGMLAGVPSSDINLFIALIFALAALAMVGTMAILCFTKASGIVFLGSPRTEAASQVKEDVERVMIFPMMVLSILTFVIGMYPQYFVGLALAPTLLFVSPEAVTPLIVVLVGLTEKLSWLFFIFLMLTLVLFGIRMLIRRKADSHTTWGCGYDRPNNNMQYTAASYAGLFTSTLKPLFKRVSHIKKPRDLFPKEAYYEQEIEDIEEAYIVKPLVKWDEKLLTKFERIQSGNIQQYILFGLIFLIAAIIGMIYLG